MKNVKVSKILRILADDGWYLDRYSGDHREFKHPTKKGVVTASLQQLSADGSSVVLNGSRGLGSDKLGWS